MRSGTSRAVRMKLKHLLMAQYINGKFNRADIAVRYLFLEWLHDRSRVGSELYRKMQRGRWPGCSEEKIDNAVRGYIQLYYSICDVGIKEPITLNPDLTIGNGAHRVACSLYLNIKRVPVIVNSKHRPISDFSITWFMENGFTPRELNIIQYRLEWWKWLRWC